MSDDKLTTWEKAALVLSMAGQILSVFVWYVGHDADLSSALPWLKVGFGIAGAIALDLVVVTTTMGRRAGRQSWWGALTILAAALFSAAIALDAAGGPTLGAWNHISYPVVIVLFAQHLAAPKIDSSARVLPPALDVPTITEVAPAQLPAPAEIDSLIALPLPDEARAVVIPPRAKRQRKSDPILRYRDVDKLSFQAIGDKLGVSRQAAQVRYRRAKQAPA